VKLTYRFRHPKSAQLDLLCIISKKLYNQANWYIRQDFFHLENWLRYQDLNFILQHSDNYKLLKAQTSQQILKIIDKNWKSFFKAIKEWKKSREKFNGRPRPPKYKNDDYNLLIFTNQNSKITSNKIILTMSKFFKKAFLEFEHPIEITIPHYRNKNFECYQQIRILPRKKFYEIEVVYKRKVEKAELNYSSYLSIDFGLNNLITTVENRNEKPIIVSGRVLKSINRQWNKQKARLNSIKDRQNLKWTNRLESITINRNSVITDYLHKTAQFLIGYCLENQIGHMCLGNLKNIKQNIRMGKRNNQNFVNIPIQKLKQMITYYRIIIVNCVHTLQS